MKSMEVCIAVISFGIRGHVVWQLSDTGSTKLYYDDCQANNLGSNFFDNETDHLIVKKYFVFSCYF